MLLLNGSANRDERHFDRARSVRRPPTGAHLSFGYGLHFCLGAALARLRGASRSRRSCGGGRRGTSTPTGGRWPTPRASVGGDLPSAPDGARTPWMSNRGDSTARRRLVDRWDRPRRSSPSSDVPISSSSASGCTPTKRSARTPGAGQRRADRGHHDQRRRCAPRAGTGLRDLRRQRAGAGRGRRARLRAAPRRRGERRHDDVTALINPLAFDPPDRERARRRPPPGGASIYASGIEPGFLCDHLPLVLSTQSRPSDGPLLRDRPLRRLRRQEIMIDALGFGRPMDFEPWISCPAAIAGEFRGQIRSSPTASGSRSRRSARSRPPTDRSAHRDRVRDRRAGHVRRDPLPAIGVVDGREAIVIDHITRLARHVGPDWPNGEATSPTGS